MLSTLRAPLTFWATPDTRSISEVNFSSFWRGVGGVGGGGVTSDTDGVTSSDTEGGGGGVRRGGGGGGVRLGGGGVSSSLLSSLTGFNLPRLAMLSSESCLNLLLACS